MKTCSEISCGKKLEISDYQKAKLKLLLTKLYQQFMLRVGQHDINNSFRMWFTLWSKEKDRKGTGEAA